MPEETITVADLKDSIAEKLAVFDTVEVLNQQVVKTLQDIEDCNCPDWVKNMAYEAKHIIWASMDIGKDTLQKVRAVIEE